MMNSKTQNEVEYDTFKGRFVFMLKQVDEILAQNDSIILYKKYIDLIIKNIQNYKNFEVPYLDLSRRVFSNTIRSKFDVFISAIDAFLIFMQRISKKDQTETILSESFTQDIVFIDHFRSQFNYYIIELKLFVNYTFPIKNYPEKEIVFKVLDIYTYRDIINNALSKQNKYSKDKIAIFNERLNEIKAIEEELRSKKLKLDEENLKSKTKIGLKTFEEEVRKITNSIIDYDDIVIQTEIGNGSEGMVNSGYLKSTQRAIAVKQLINQVLDYYNYSFLYRQIKIMTELNNFAILHFIGISINPICIITEYMPNGSLFDRLHDTNPETLLSPTKRTIIGLGIAYALNFMHKKVPPLLHRDVKSLNVLLDSEDFPKLCDFGSSRYTTEDNDITPSCVGTTNWMAPEVIKGYEYTEKSDVYSYGVVLWELLTGKVPFENMNSKRVRDEVAYNNRRLEIQRQDCPPELRSLLARCWAADPKNRPSFDQIIECFEKGTVKFIGTQTDQVKAYISLFQSSSANDESYEFPVITDSIVNSICNELDAGKEEAALKANSVLSKEDNHQFVLQFNLIKSIVHAIDKCDSSRFANSLTKTVDIICRYKNLISEFEKEDGASKFIKLFIKFGATAKKNIIQTLMLLISNVSGVNMNYNAISKITPFLLFNDLSCRLNALKLLNIICDMKIYDSENSFNIVIRNVLTNIFPKAKIELIIESLNLLLKLVKLSELNLSILATEGIIKLTAMINYSNSDVSMKSLKIIEELLKLTTPHKNVVKAILSCIPEVGRSKNNDKINAILVILAYSLKSKVTLTKIQSKSNKEIIECFKAFLSSDNSEIVINSLKLCYSFIYNSIPQFIDLSDNYLALLANDSKIEIPILAASCLTLVYQKQPFNLSDNKNNKLIEDFLKKQLSNNSINVQILNLCGVISTYLDGAIFFDNIGILSLLLNLIDKADSKDFQISRTATMILASLSALNPLCNHISEAFPTIFKMLKLNQNSPYPIIFITNVASTAVGSFECSKNISDIIKNAEIDFPRTIVAIQRIITDIKAKEEIFSKTNENINLLISLLLKKWNIEKNFLSIIDEIAASESGKKAILESEMYQVLQKQFNEIDLLNESRPLLLRILSRIKS